MISLMNPTNCPAKLVIGIRRGFLAAMCFSLPVVFCGIERAQAQLPLLNQQPWFGFFVGHKGSQSVFGVAADGSMVYNHNNELPSVISGHPHRIYANVEETLPDGQTRIRRLDPETLETTDEPTDKPGKVSYRGKVAGGATIEVGIEFSRRDIHIGGRIVDPGESKNPLRFILVTRTPPYYRFYQEQQRLTSGTEEDKAKIIRDNERQREKIKKETMTLRRIDGTRVRQLVLEPVSFSATGFNGDGFSEIDIEFDWLRGRRITFSAGSGSLMTLSNKDNTPIYKNGFNFKWMSDPAKDPKGGAKLTISTR